MHKHTNTHFKKVQNKNTPEPNNLIYLIPDDTDEQKIISHPRVNIPSNNHPHAKDQSHTIPLDEDTYPRVDTRKYNLQPRATNNTCSKYSLVTNVITAMDVNVVIHPSIGKHTRIYTDYPGTRQIYLEQILR